MDHINGNIYDLIGTEIDLYVQRKSTFGGRWENRLGSS